MRELRGKKDDSPLVFDNPEDSFSITGRGVAFTSSRWKLPEGMWEPWDMVGHMAILDGVEVKIIGVEAFAMNRSPGSPYPHSFGLMVSVEDAKKVGWVEK